MIADAKQIAGELCCPEHLGFDRVRNMRGTALKRAVVMAALITVALATSMLVAPQKALAYNPKAETVEVSNVDQLLDQIASSRMMPYTKNIVLTDDIDFNEFDPEGSKLQEIVKAMVRSPSATRTTRSKVPSTARVITLSA